MSRGGPFTIKGLVEFQEYMSHLPETLNDEAAGIVESAAIGAEREIYSVYPSKTGELRAGLGREVHKEGTSTTVIVKSRSDHASAFDKGTEERYTRRGWRRGKMPAPQQGKAMIPIARRWRGRMIENLVKMLARNGFEIHNT